MATSNRVFVRANPRKATQLEKKLEKALKNMRETGTNKAGSFDSAFKKLPKVY